MESLENTEVRTIKGEDDGSIPNHPFYPLLIYKNVISPEDNPKEILKRNRWLGIWQNGVAPYHHYHSNSHEVLVVTKGNATVQFGGAAGSQVFVEEGDVAILPAGFGHKRLESSYGFTVVGAYPDGREYNTYFGKDTDRPQNLEEIKSVPLPDYDPIFGEVGPLFSHWKN